MPNEYYFCEMGNQNLLDDSTIKDEWHKVLIEDDPISSRFIAEGNLDELELYLTSKMEHATERLVACAKLAVRRC
jgi:hypothetical protein